MSISQPGNCQVSGEKLDPLHFETKWLDVAEVSSDVLLCLACFILFHVSIFLLVSFSCWRQLSQLLNFLFFFFSSCIALVPLLSYFLVTVFLVKPSLSHRVIMHQTRPGSHSSESLDSGLQQQKHSELNGFTQFVVSLDYSLALPAELNALSTRPPCLPSVPAQIYQHCPTPVLKNTIFLGVNIFHSLFIYRCCSGVTDITQFTSYSIYIIWDRLIICHLLF